MGDRYDAIVVGGGHNGLVAGAYLARAGARAVVLEARHKTGGAAATDAPWPDAPELRVPTLSYVFSHIPRKIRRDLNLKLKLHPTGPYYVPFPDGRSLMRWGDPAQDAAEYAKFSPKDAGRAQGFEDWLAHTSGALAPLMTTKPPKFGSKHPGDLLDQLKFFWRLRGLDNRTISDLTRLVSTSAADLLDEWFESDQVKVSYAIDGIIGTWAGPREPGTAFVMAHHAVGDTGGGAMSNDYGIPEGGMGAVADAIRDSATRFGCEIRTEARVQRILTVNGRARGVVLESGEEILARIVVTATNPKITFLEHLDPSELPEQFVADIRRFRVRGGVVKINVAISELPTFLADPDKEIDFSGGIELAHSVDYVERAFIDAREGRAAALPFSDGEIPTMHDRTLAPDGIHIMSLYTQWVPETWSSEQPQAELDAYADRVIAGYDELAPGFKASVIHRQVIGPYEMEKEWGLIGGNIFHGEVSPDQLFHMRPAPGYADWRTPIAGLYQCSNGTHGVGGVCGIPAYNAVKEVLKDHRRRRWGRRAGA